MDANAIYDMCLSCAQSVYNTRPPSPQYARRVANLLFGTAAHESAGFRYRRQLGFSYRSRSGAWGLWQIESASVADSLVDLISKDKLELSNNAARWVGQSDDMSWHWWVGETSHDICKSMVISDRVSCLFSRLHYLRFPEPVPESLGDQAAYWKAHYNTYLGRGTPEDYLRSWVKFAAPVISERDGRI